MRHDWVEEMVMKNGYNISIGVFCLFLWAVPGLAVCPSMDATGDCRVDLRDFAVFAGQWLSGDGIPDDMVAIPGGTFSMGDSFNEGFDNERPVHIVTLDSFYMSKYEIANGQYCEFLNATQPKVVDGVVYGRLDAGNRFPYIDTSDASSYSQIDFTVGPFGRGRFSLRLKGRSDMSNDPVGCVSWYGAAAYCNWRSQREGRPTCYNLSTWACDFRMNGYRLPTEAEWEYAARGGLSGQRFPWGMEISHKEANYNSDNFYSYDKGPTPGYHPTWNDGIYPYTSPVGSFASNDYGLYDMAGNVGEWCNDWYMDTYYKDSPPSNPTGPATSASRVLRGGSWAAYSVYCRVSFRDRYGPDRRGYAFGFRVVLGLN
jgi:formylglycine-generating enzyme